ncbi:hypothetical protein H2200_000313 [Cladophialophora chaetospira]|uniref:Uncharacterized protein n=1 Tax=Cladophialophora chaetospira TaxID=386627 RepID=A0AA38XNA6_9EURO|nr:hypothetical protein H2200_000313 [Cladophialophora chaetospira]
MRLQLLIQRYALPPVTIIHTTGTGPSSHTKSRFATISDLLSDVNDLVPLESSDGEWGLEDYVVEVAATGDQELTYECLHFQTIQSVLKSDDEVVVRALTNDDLRMRRLGGRHQITGDGRHLIDGIPFGKQWLRKTTRPGIIIPPRKKRRLLVEEDSALDDSEEDTKPILSSSFEQHDRDESGALVPFTVYEDEDEDEEDDDDYVDGDEDDNHELQNQIALREDFDDADADSDGELILDSGELSSEVKQLLEDAAEIEHASNLAIASRVLDKQLKRKRTPEDDGEHDEQEEEEIFEGLPDFSLPSTGTTTVLTNGVSDGYSDDEDGSDSLFDEIAAQQEEKRANNLVEDDDDDSADSDATSSSDASSSDSDADGPMDELAMAEAKKRALNLIRDSDDAVDEDETSSSGSDTDEDDEVSDTTSSSGSDSDADETSESETSSSSESEVESDAESAQERTSPVKLGSQSAAAPSTATQYPPKSRDAPTKELVGIPFEGTKKTHANNDRIKRRKRLDALKQQGVLPPGADFKALAQYEAAQESGNQAANQDLRADVQVTEDIQMETENPEATAEESMIEVDKENIKPPANGGAPTVNEIVPEPVSTVPEIPETSQLDSQSIMEPSPKRARLDVASGRRMILGSLGLRVPKTAEDTQKLREKLSQNVRQLKQRKEEQAASVLQFSQPEAEHDNDAWKNKLIVSAVECEEPGGVLPPPPFPFQQGWAKPNKNKRKMRDQNQYYQGRSDRYQEDKQEDATDVKTLNYDDNPAEHNDRKGSSSMNNAGNLPTEKELEELPNLDRLDIQPGATIAYQELHIDASTNYEPAISSYRVGQVSQQDDDGTVHLQLEKGSFGSQQAGHFDEETGERIYGKFELADEDADEEDDGAREISFSTMIKPRLVKRAARSSSVQVFDSSSATGLRGGEASMSFMDDDVAIVPESAEQAIDTQLSSELQASIHSDETEKPALAIEAIDTPRKQEIDGIIKEAGFQSALDEELLHPIANPATDNAEDLDDNDDDESQPQGKYAHRFRRRSPRVIITSSDQQPASMVEDEQHFEGDVPEAEPNGVSSIPATSSPYMPTQTTVDYPHISQIDIASSAPVRTANSSSHQDAQKLSPVPALDQSIAVSVQETRVDHSLEPAVVPETIEVNQRKPSPVVSDSENRIYAPPESSQEAGSEVGQTQFPQVTSDLTSSPILAPDNEGSSVQQNSFLDVPGFDGGNDSSYHDSGHDEDSDLPSLSEFTSERRTSTRTSARPTKKTSPIAPARKSLRSSNASDLRGNRSRRNKKSPSLPTSPELPPSSQLEFKQSQSQREPRLSQIPLGSQVVDLTLSSDPLSPMKSPLENNHDEDEDSDYVSSRRGKGKAKTTTRRTGGRWSKQESQESGIGKRTLLTRKRDSDPKYY